MSSSSATGNEPSTAVALPEVASPLLKAFDFDFTSTNYEFDDSISEEERRFYLKMYPTVDTVNQRKVHCTVCKMHVGTSPSAEQNIKMHPILRVTHCSKCHDFYNSGEFSKGEDGSELYCRWCGQGGEVYCCSTCPFVFCKSCIIKNLSRGVIIDIEQNENWNCFKCTSKILWPLRAQHWALTNYIETQKNGLQTLQLPEAELRKHMIKDKSSCCRLAKAKISGLSDSMESLESNASKRSRGSSVGSAKKSSKSQQGQGPPVKRPKSSNDEVVCTPDLLSMLEPDCQISVTPKPASRATISIASSSSSKTSTPRIVTVQQNYTGPSPSTSASTSASSSSNGNAAAMSRSSLPPPLVLSSSGMRYRGSTPSPASSTARAARNPVPSAIRSAAPVFHTINGYRVDLNSAAQQDSYRLPNGRLIQVKRQMPANAQPSTPLAPAVVNPQLMMGQRGAAGPRMLHNSPAFGNNIGIYNPQSNPQQRTPQMVRMNNSNQAQSMLQTNSNGGGTTITMTPASMVNKPTLVRQTFPDTPIGKARKQLQDRVFNAMEICTHLTGKVQSFTNSNAYNTARSSMELKELYVHISYMMTYAIGRFKQLQDKCLVDMREMGFKNDANSLENGQLAAAVDYVCYGQLDDVDLYNTGSNSFHNQVYEYRKSLHANLKDGEHQEPLPPLRALGESVEVEIKAEIEDDEQQEQHNINLEPEAQFNDDEDDDDDFDDEHDALDTEENMNRNEQAHAYDRKLTRLLREYPSIWCTQHPDYGNMEVTHKQWRVIASHFPRGDDIKLRWKNVRKRYVRIERRLKQGKRFRGYCDKATNYLANRDLPLSEWLHVDCGEDDGDGFERKQLDAIENTIHQDMPAKNSGRLLVRPIEVCTIDQRIINFAKSHPVLWRKSADPEFNSIDEQTRKSLWYNFCKTTPKYRTEYIVERWQQMYEMYKSFRLKTIKDKRIFANLELKYSKYLASLYFLYKIDEQDLRDEFEPLQDYAEQQNNAGTAKLKDMPDDKQFVQQLVLAIRVYPTLWNPRHVEYEDVGARERLWAELARRLARFRRDARACKLRWQMAKFAYECYNRELEREPRPNDKTLQKLSSNFPLEEIRFLNA
ncbi:uncharacterized protein LOC108596505 [Drosophila busckii]|uniref:uncharacterized protein LOC108596505 n=1 Tax=Drosophila busckii TaxID=30019 RepID=UPI00083EFA61|nr:uncharacterized protein LOC108596505 [Drosophila busckii]XP_017837833.1 uncharacterized protein LOC108596505 [Drosophila busckii]